MGAIPDTPVPDRVVFTIFGVTLMPIYEYACRKCEHRLDALQKVADAPLVDCPECGQPELRRLLSAPRFRLKGTGWYETDFKKDNQRNLAGEKEPGKKDDKAAGEQPKKEGADKPAAADKPAKPAKAEPAAKSDTKPA